MKELHVIQATLPYTQVIVDKDTPPDKVALEAFKVAVGRLQVTTHKAADLQESAGEEQKEGGK